MAAFLGNRPVGPNQPIYADMTMNLGDMEVHICLTPGHTPTNICVYVHKERVLYCGDCLVTDRERNPNMMKPDDCHLWLESLQRIEDLEPVTIVPGHGRIVRQADCTKAIDQLPKCVETSMRA